MDEQLCWLLTSFDTVRLGTLAKLIPGSEPEDIENLIVRLVMEGKLKNVVIDGEFVVNMNRDNSTLLNVLEHVDRLSGPNLSYPYCHGVSLALYLSSPLNVR